MRLFFDNVSSFGTDNPLTFADDSTTTGTFNSPPPFPTINGAGGFDYAVVTNEPDTDDEEITYLVAFTEGDTTAEFIRAQEGTTGVAHSATPWIHGPTALDFTTGRLPQTPLMLPQVDLVTVEALPDFTFTATGGPGDNITANANGALTVDGTAVTTERICVTTIGRGIGGPVAATGIYDVTAPGDGGTPFVLTRSPDANTSNVMGTYWGTTSGALGTDAPFALCLATPFGSPFEIGESELEISTSLGALGNDNDTGLALGLGAQALGGSQALGQFSSAANNGTALGFEAIATGTSSLALGNVAIASGEGSVALGNDSTASGINATAVGNFALAYDAMTVLAAGSSISSQASVLVCAQETSDATPTVLTGGAGAWSIRFVDASGAANWTKTMIVRARAVARGATPGNDAAWDMAAGVVRGDGSSAYTWIGGSAPTFTFIAHDTGVAATWTITIAIGTDGAGAPALIVTATADGSMDVGWACILDIEEVSI